MSVCERCGKEKIGNTFSTICLCATQVNGTSEQAEPKPEVNEIEKYVEEVLLELYKKVQSEKGGVSGVKVKEITGGDEGINWGDLHCVEVGTFTCVDIEEVSPEAYHFRQYVYEKLKEKYPHLSFKINTEW